MSQCQNGADFEGVTLPQLSKWSPEWLFGQVKENETKWNETKPDQTKPKQICSLNCSAKLCANLNEWPSHYPFHSCLIHYVKVI